MNTQSFLVRFIFVSGLAGLAAANIQAENIGYLLIDDFTQESSKLGTVWEGFTDQVMGGVSEMNVRRISTPEDSYIKMTGNVSLERNGGFIQIQLKLAKKKSFDASTYSGIRLKVRGTGSSYYLFLRTTANILPWKFYKAQVPVTAEWQTVDIPWEAFKGGDYGKVGALNVKKLTSIALCGYGEQFYADIEMGEIGIY